MVKYCSAYDCYSYCGTSGLSFHRIPKDVVRRKQWISALKLKRQLKWDCVWICSDHFTPDSYENTKHELGLHKKKRLKKNAIPTIFSYKKQEETTGRKRRIEERERKQSKRKGLSAEEKRTRMMEFFYEKKDFFQLRELEKQCQKEKGITSMSVKDILQSLVDDAMVDTDKIGTSVYFWAFPSKASQNRKRKMDELSSKLSDGEEKQSTMRTEIKKAKIGKEQTDERSAALSELSSLQGEKAHLMEELQKYKDCDPEVLEAKRQDAVQAKEAANRWTDNIFSTKSWIKRKFAFEEKVIDKQFEIPEDFDYIE